ncbi:MAG: SPOR domain-containing protein [Sterolibacteriaceae bacterium MAG5]|nr:SPOR domain-containing protein [Candidatus Nitricoxidireducens bremensis]
MAEPVPEPLDADEALKKRLISRIAVAGVMVVALLGGLAVFDALNVKPPPEPEEPEQVAKAPQAEPAKAEEKPAEAKPEEAKAEEAKTEEKPGEKLADAAAKPEEAKPEPPAPAAVPSLPERTASVAAPAPRSPRPLTVPATARPAAIRPSEPVLAHPRIEPEREIARTTEPASPVARHAPASRPLTQATTGTRQYLVQMGVFSNLANAEELRAKLELAGIPAQIEARVQVGPFRSRAEADAAREKLRAMGMETGILTAIRR